MGYPLQVFPEIMYLVVNDIIESCSGIPPYLTGNTFQKYLLENKDITIYFMMIVVYFSFLFL